MEDAVEPVGGGEGGKADAKSAEEREEEVGEQIGGGGGKVQSKSAEEGREAEMGETSGTTEGEVAGDMEEVGMHEGVGEENPLSDSLGKMADRDDQQQESLEKEAEDSAGTNSGTVEVVRTEKAVEKVPAVVPIMGNEVEEKGKHISVQLGTPRDLIPTYLPVRSTSWESQEEEDNDLSEVTPEEPAEQGALPVYPVQETSDPVMGEENWQQIGGRKGQVSHQAI